MGGGRFGSRNGPAVPDYRAGGDSLPRWNESGSMSPLDQRRTGGRGGRNDSRGYDSPGMTLRS